MFRKLQRVAALFLTGSDYLYDPEHKSSPKGGGWRKTNKGWSRKDIGGKKTPSVQDSQDVWKSPKLPFPSHLPDVINVLDVKSLSDKQRQSLTQRYTNWLGKVQALTQGYANWSGKVQGQPQTTDLKGKIESVKLAIKMLQPPKFKKAEPRLHGNIANIIKDNDLGYDELSELTGFKNTIKDHPQMSDTEYRRRIENGIRLPRNQAQLKSAFVANMHPGNYESLEAFVAAKKRIQKMTVGDFGKLLASIFSEEEE